MKTKLLHIIRNWPLFLFLLPVFFMLHVLQENFAPGLGATMLLQVFWYTAIAFLLAFLFFLVLKNMIKAAFVSLFLVSFNFFFGSLHDGLKKIAGQQFFLTKYIFIIPFIAILTIALVIGLKKTKKDFRKICLFMNVVFFVFILLELVQLVPRSFHKKGGSSTSPSDQVIDCDSCQRPDVYVIIADEYAGHQELREVFSFDNTHFETELKDRGFHIINNSRSNYNATVYSMASLFNMNYIDLSDAKKETQRDILLCRSIINNNRVGQFFRNKGYDISNYSFFEFQGQEKSVSSHFFLPKSEIFTSQTFTSRFINQAGFNFLGQRKVKGDKENDYYKYLHNDEKIDSLTRAAVIQNDAKPKFIYSHFARPHAPFYFDREGKPFSHGSSLQGFKRKQKEYTEYLLFTNKRLLDLIDHILNKSSTPPVILLASDHGCRFLPGEVADEYNFMNLCAVLLPGARYEKFYEGMSTVNTFRIILNSAFGQRLPLLKDSTAYLQLHTTE